MVRTGAAALSGPDGFEGRLAFLLGAGADLFLLGVLLFCCFAEVLPSVLAA